MTELYNSIDHTEIHFISFVVFDTDPYEVIFDFQLGLLHQFLSFLNLKANCSSVRQLTMSLYSLVVINRMQGHFWAPMLSCTILIVPVEEVTLQLQLWRSRGCCKKTVASFNDKITYWLCAVNCTAAESGMSHMLCNKLTDAKECCLTIRCWDIWACISREDIQSHHTDLLYCIMAWLDFKTWLSIKEQSYWVKSHCLVTLPYLSLIT